MDVEGKRDRRGSGIQISRLCIKEKRGMMGKL